jgi:UDP-N-acetyl-D-mannosaminuronate dehydrogenase
VDLTEALATADCVVIVAGHQATDYSQVVNQTRLVVDAVNVTNGLNGSARVVRVGAPFSERVG